MRKNTLTIEMPKTGFTDVFLDNLQKIIASKAALLKKAPLGTDNLAVIDTGDTLKFPWFALHGWWKAKRMPTAAWLPLSATRQRNRNASPQKSDTGNDNSDMRLFLVRLGFVGDEYKEARKILLRSLTGNSSWKSAMRRSDRLQHQYGEDRTAPTTQKQGR